MKETPLIGRLDAAVVRVAACIIICAAVVSGWTAASVWDDAYTFARYADSVLAARGICFNPFSPPTYGLTSVGYLVAVIPFRFLFTHSPSLPLLFSSLVCGLLFIVLTAVLTGGIGRSFEGRWKSVTWLLVALALAHAAPDLAAHFVSGMDTMFALAFISLYLLVCRAFENNPSLRSAVTLGLLGGAAFWVRPDLLLYSAGIPAALAVFSVERRVTVRACVALGITVVFAVILVIVSAWYFGSPLPLPFYAKTLGLYGPSIESVYRYTGLRQLCRYVLSYAVVFTVIVLALVRGPRDWWESLSAVGKGACVSTGFFLLFHCCLVLQIMPYNQRFYYPSLPAILLVALESARFLSRNLPSGVMTSSPHRRAAVVLSLVLYMASSGTVWHPGRLLEMPGIWSRGFDVADNYRNTRSGYWFRLDEFSGLPDDLVMAATEVGHPIAMNPGKRVIDLSGLNETMLAHTKFSAGRFFASYQPDVIFMPHVDYAEMIAEITADPAFRSAYDYYPPAVTRTELGIAVRRDSRYFERMNAIVGERVTRRGGQTP